MILGLPLNIVGKVARLHRLAVVDLVRDQGLGQLLFAGRREPTFRSTFGSGARPALAAHSPPADRGPSARRSKSHPPGPVVTGQSLATSEVLEHRPVLALEDMFGHDIDPMSYL